MYLEKSDASTTKNFLRSLPIDRDDLALENSVEQYQIMVLYGASYTELCESCFFLLGLKYRFGDLLQIPDRFYNQDRFFPAAVGRHATRKQVRVLAGKILMRNVRLSTCLPILLFPQLTSFSHQILFFYTSRGVSLCLYSHHGMNQAILTEDEDEVMVLKPQCQYANKRFRSPG